MGIWYFEKQGNWYPRLALLWWLAKFFFRFCSCWFVGGGKMSYLQKLFLFTVNEREFFWYGSYRCRSSRLQRLLYLREQLVDSLWRNMELGFLLQCSGINILFIIPVIEFKFFSGFVYPCELLSWGLATMSVSNCKQEKRMFVSQGFRVHAKHYCGQQSAAFGLSCYMNNWTWWRGRIHCYAAAVLLMLLNNSYVYLYTRNMIKWSCLSLKRHLT